MKSWYRRFVVFVLAALLVAVLPFAPTAEAAESYSMVLTNIADDWDVAISPSGGHSSISRFDPTFCSSQACNDKEWLYQAAGDVTGRVDPVTVDMYIYAPAHSIFSTSLLTITASGPDGFYTSSDLPIGYSCALEDAGFTAHCSARIGPDTNPVMKVGGRKLVPSSTCQDSLSAGNTTYNQTANAKIVKTRDTSKFDLDSVSEWSQCWAYNQAWRDAIQWTFNHDEDNDGLNDSMAPTAVGTTRQIAQVTLSYDESMEGPYNTYPSTAGVLTATMVIRTPSYVNMTGCTVSRTLSQGQSLPSSQCVIDNAHLAHVTTSMYNNTNPVISMTGTITAPSGCPTNGSAYYDYVQYWVYRTADGVYLSPPPSSDTAYFETLFSC